MKKNYFMIEVQTKVNKKLQFQLLQSVMKDILSISEAEINSYIQNYSDISFVDSALMIHRVVFSNFA